MAISSNYSKCIKGINFNFIVNNIELANNGIVIFTPSAKSTLAKDIYPYFPRVKWSNELSDYCTIYISDPFDREKHMDGFSGSWFLSMDGKSALPMIASIILNIISPYSGPIIIYGSSMGGFSALYLGKLIEADGIIAEAPQIDLEQYHTSRDLIKSLKLRPSKEWIDPFIFFRINGFPRGFLHIYINLGDSSHIRYVIDAIRNPENIETLRLVTPGRFEVKITPHTSGFGHVNMNMSEGVIAIRNMFNSIMNDA